MQDHMTTKSNGEREREREEHIESRTKKRHSTRNENEYKYRIEFFVIRSFFLFTCAAAVFVCCLCSSLCSRDANEHTDCWNWFSRFKRIKKMQWVWVRVSTGCNMVKIAAHDSRTQKKRTLCDPWNEVIKKRQQQQIKGKFQWVES